MKILACRRRIEFDQVAFDFVLSTHGDRVRVVIPIRQPQSRAARRLRIISGLMAEAGVNGIDAAGAVDEFARAAQLAHFDSAHNTLWMVPE